jgi:hypothetical protein
MSSSNLLGWLLIMKKNCIKNFNEMWVKMFYKLMWREHMVAKKNKKWV